MQAFEIVVIVICAVILCLIAAGIINKPSSVFRNDPSARNPMEGKTVRFVENDSEAQNADGVCGHLEAVGVSVIHRSFYDRIVKRCIDAVLSFFGLIILSPVLLILSAAIIIDDPGPVLFSQKRVGINKRYFRLHKFRSTLNYINSAA